MEDRLYIVLVDKGLLLSYDLASLLSRYSYSCVRVHRITCTASMGRAAEVTMVSIYHAYVILACAMYIARSLYIGRCHNEVGVIMHHR